MTAFEYQKQAQKLFEGWKAKPRHDGKGFVEDGIIDPETWFSDREKDTPKIVFVLKEAYDSQPVSTGWSLANWLKEGCPHYSAMWHRVAEWADGLLRLHETPDMLPPYQQLTFEQTRTILSRVAVINIKKSDGKSSSDYDNLKKYRDEDRKELQEQIALIDPDVIVCGYTFSLVNNVLALNLTRNNGNRIDTGEQTDIGIYPIPRTNPASSKADDTALLIDYYHPANRYPIALKYYALMAIYQQALKKEK